MDLVDLTAEGLYCNAGVLIGRITGLACLFVCLSHIGF